MGGQIVGPFVLIMRIVLSLIFNVFILITPILCAIVFILSFYLTDRMKFTLYQRLLRLYSTVLICIGFLRVSSEGEGNIPETGPVILFANHASLIDSFLIIRQTKRDLRMFAGIMLFRVPFLSYFLRKAGYLPIFYRDPLLSAGSLGQAVNYINNGGLFLTFASRRQSSEEDIGAIQQGLFEMAAKTGSMVVPVAIKGTKDFLSGRKMFMIRPGKVYIKFGKPINIAEIMKNEGKNSAESMIRSVIRDLYREVAN